jgi:hypothetical protein
MSSSLNNFTLNDGAGVFEKALKAVCRREAPWNLYNLLVDN